MTAPSPDVFPHNAPGPGAAAGPVQSVLDKPPNLAGIDSAMERLGRMVSGSDRLVTQPGLVQALFQNNATPEQAQAIDSFMGGLQAEQKVRLASQSGTKIPLSTDEQQSLNAMGIPYQSVLFTHQDAIDTLTQQMAAQGVKPVLDAAGQPQVDANGNPLSQALKTPEAPKRKGFGRFFHDITHNPITSLVMDGTINTNGPDIGGNGPGLKGVASGLNQAYQAGSAAFSSGLNQGIQHLEHPNDNPMTNSVLTGTNLVTLNAKDSELAQKLGYDPSSVFSVQAFKSRGYSHNDTSHVESQWDSSNPAGLFGWSGSQAVTEAEAFTADPEKYRRAIENDASLTPEQVAQKVAAISSTQFQTLVKQVNGTRADFGHDVANALQIDPVKHSTLYNTTQVGTNLLAQFFTDPIAVGLSGVRAAAIQSTAIRNFSDAEGIRRVLSPADGVGSTMAQARTIGNVRAMVDTAKAIRDADATGNVAVKAALQARLDASNPFAALLPDFLGTNQIIRPLTEAEIKSAKLGSKELPFVVGAGKPIETYADAVDYLASKNALLRLQGGVAPVEATYMPGALSSGTYKQLKGSLASWSAGRQAAKGVAAESKYLAWATDPGRVGAMLDNGTLTRVLPQNDDAVDVLRGQVLAAQERFSQTATAVRQGRTELDNARGELDAANAAARASGKIPANYNDLRSVHAQTGKLVDRLDQSLQQQGDALASARRALDEHLANAQDAAATPGTFLTDAARGDIRRSNLTYGTDLPPSSAVGKVLAYGTTGMAQRARLAASRFTNWLPRDTHINLLDASSGDTVKKIARTYLNAGDANMLASRWALADGAGRKAIVQGLKEQIAHAAGLTKTKAGRDLIQSWKTANEKYATNGLGVVDDNGVETALHLGQVRDTFNLPNFGRVQQASAKVGLYEATMGRLMSSAGMNSLLMQWKLGALATPVTAIRASVESWVAAAADGQFVHGLQAKALLKEAGRLSGEDISRSAVVDKLAQLAPLQGLGRFYRHVLTARVDPEFEKAILEMPDDLLHSYVHEQAALHYAMQVDPAGVGDRAEAARAGFASKEIRYDSKEGWNDAVKNRVGYELTDELNGIRGVRTYAHNLAIRVNKSPEVARAMLDRIEHADTTTTADVVTALESPAYSRLLSHTKFGNVFWRPDGTQARAVTDAEQVLGKQQWADRMTAEFKTLLEGRNGRVNSKVTGFIRKHGVAPDEDWLLDNAKAMDRPEKMLAPMFEAVAPAGGLQAKVDALLDAEGKGYQWLVERLIQRHTTTPLFTAAYGDAKVGLEGFKTDLINGGLSTETAERASANVAASQAWSRIARMVDDPAMKSQMDVAGRGFFAFSRATTMMLRRWGDIAWRNPAAARRLMLAGEGAVHSGLVYKDENGQWDFHFPGSGVAQEVIFHAMSHIPGLDGLAKFHASDFTGHVASIIPGSTNPFQYSTTPMISISGRKIAGLFPNQRELFDEVDAKLNGTQGQGVGVVDTLIPTPVKKFKDVFDSNQRNSILSSATVGSLFNLYAAGQVPPEGAPPAEWDAFYNNLKTGVRSQLFLRATLGMLSPATIAVPDNQNGASAPDFAFAQSGSQGLRDEYKRLLNDVNGDVGRASAIFTALHPDKTVYTASASQSTTSKAVMPATQAALQWMQSNSGFIQRYKSVAAYFIPEQSAGQPYSMAAYRAQLETGLRERKTPDEFYRGVRISTDGNEYYAMKDSFQAEIDKANAEGNDTYAKARTAQWSDWAKEFKAQHPLFADNLQAGSADRRVQAEGQLADLRLMVGNKAVPDKQASVGLAGMISAYDNYKTFIAAHPGGTNLSTQQRHDAFDQLQGYMDAVVKAVPQLTDVYRGVFRTLNSNLAQAAYS